MLTEMFRTTLTHRKWLILMLCLVAVLILLSPSLKTRPINFIAAPATDLLSLLLGGVSFITGGASQIWDDYINLTKTQKENKELTEEVERLRAEVLRLRELALQNSRLRELLDFKSASQHQLTAASVLSRDVTNWYRTITINKGSRGGLKEGMGAVTPAGVVGRIIRTTPFTSQVLLITDHRSSVAGLIQRTRDEGLVEGAEEGHIRMKYLPAIANLQEGDVVMTSGLADIFPKGLIIGYISEVQKKDNDLFQVVEIKPAADLSKLEEVLVVISP